MFDSLIHSVTKHAEIRQTINPKYKQIEYLRRTYKTNEWLLGITGLVKFNYVFYFYIYIDDGCHILVINYKCCHSSLGCVCIGNLWTWLNLA